MMMDSSRGPSGVSIVRVWSELEDTLVCVALFVFEFLEPGKERALPSPTRLSHAVDGLAHDAHRWLSIGWRILRDGVAKSAGRERVIHDFACLQGALQVGGDKVPSSRGESERRCGG